MLLINEEGIYDSGVESVGIRYNHKVYRNTFYKLRWYREAFRPYDEELFCLEGCF